MSSFALSIFLASAQLFLVQPMFAKRLLPILGGTPSVWTTCMLFYQLLLLGGYLYAHVLTKRWNLRLQLIVHSIVILLPLAVFAIGPPVWKPPDANSAVQWLLSYLLISVGMPFFVLSTNSPLVQRWFANTPSGAGKTAYSLYSISNLGSMFALVAYPFLLEPHLRLSEQYNVLIVLYVVYVASMFGVIFKCWRFAGANDVIDEEKTVIDSTEATTLELTAWRERLWWAFLAFIPSSVLLSVTTYVTSNIAPSPLFWIVPLALYLLTFIIAFASKQFISRVWLLCAHSILLSLLAVVFFWQQIMFTYIFMFPLHLLTFFVVALLCHTELALNSPKTNRLTEFYLCVAVGGALGGLFNALVAPAIFNSLIEYPLLLSLSCLARTPLKNPDKQSNYGPIVFALSLASVALLYFVSSDWSPEWMNFRVVAVLLPAGLLCSLIGGEPLYMLLCISMMFLVGSQVWRPNLLQQSRNVFGTIKVENRKGERHCLIHGSILHGAELMIGPLPHEPLSYYHRTSPIAEVFDAFSDRLNNARIAVVGLGCGSMAAYARPGQNWTFFEINPLVVQVASDPQLFTFLKSCAAKYQIVLGDGRQTLAESTDGPYSLIAFDAFSADAIPVHLLTREALHMYLSKLAPGGVLAFHISSRAVDLQPTLRELARDAHLACVVKNGGLTPEYQTTTKTTSTWFVMSRSEADLQKLKSSFDFKSPPASPPASVWTDDFSNLLETLRF